MHTPDRNEKHERLLQKYGGIKKAAGSAAPTLSVMGRRGGNLGAKGKPKHMRATILRLMRYLAGERLINELTARDQYSK